ncbi:MAG: hypothetical protein IPK79_08505 [Vampirovibrionales bacterium]|nr:hypothetical protein [Vampirovibrionales bacterium]
MDIAAAAPAISTAAPAASRLKRLPLLGRNLAVSAGDYGRRLTQDNGGLKSNIAVIGILIQVIARIIVAYNSAQKAKGTPDEAYRRMEFIRTTIRESLGWSLGFGGFRMFELMIKKGVRRFFQLPEAPPRHSRLVRHQMVADAVDWWRGSLQKRQAKSGLIHFATQSFEHFASPEALENKPFGATALRLVNFFSRQTPGAPFKTKLQTFYKWFPTTVGAALSIGLAGFWLERFSIDHSKEAARFIDKLINGAAQPASSTSTLGRAQQVAGAVAPSQGFGGLAQTGIRRSALFSDYLAQASPQRHLSA